MKLLLVEDFYDKLTPGLQKQIPQDSELRLAIASDNVPEELINLVKENIDIEHVLLYGDIDPSSSNWLDLIKKYLKSLDLDLSKDVETFLLARLSRQSSEDIIAGNAPFLELLKNARDKKIDLYIDILDLIYDLYKSKDIIDQDLKLKDSWLLNSNIYNNERIDGQIYKIKLHIFLDDKNTVKNFKDVNGNPLPDYLADWDAAVDGRSAKELQRLYAPYTSDAYEAKQKKNQNQISLDAYLKLRIKESAENKNNQWTETNWKNNLLAAVKASGHNNAEKLTATLKDIITQDKKKFDSMRYNLDLRSDLQLLDPKNQKDRLEFANILNKYLSNEVDLSKNIKQKKIQPNTDYKVSDALKLSGSNPGEAYGFFGRKLISHDNKKRGMTNYAKPFDKLFKNKKLVNELLNATITSNKNGGFDWTPFITRYLSNIKFPE